MEYKEFCEHISGQVKDYLPSGYANAEVSISTVEKNNGVKLQALHIRVPEQNIEPTIYLEGFYQEFQRGASMEKVLKDITNLRVEHEIPKQIEVSDLLNFEKAKNNIVFEVVGAEANKGRLSEIPHRLIHDMAYTYRIMLGEVDRFTNATIQITNDIMGKWGIDSNSLHNLAVENTQKILGAELYSMQETLTRLYSQSPSPGMDNEMKEFIEFLNSPEATGFIPMYVLSNKTNMKGAGVLFYPDMMEYLGTQMNGNYFVLPSSVHEVIIVPDDGKMDYRELREMVKEINGTQLAPDEVLTNEVYYYDRKQEALCKAADKDNVKNKLVEQVKENIQKDSAEKKKTVKRNRGANLER